MIRLWFPWGPIWEALIILQSELIGWSNSIWDSSLPCSPFPFWIQYIFQYWTYLCFISYFCSLHFKVPIWTNATEPCWLIFRKSPKVKYQICQSSWRTLLITDITSRTDPKKNWNFFSILLLLSVAFWPAAHFPCILSIQFFVHTLVISLCTH